MIWRISALPRRIFSECAPSILLLLVGRPLALTRCPEIEDSACWEEPHEYGDLKKEFVKRRATSDVDAERDAGDRFGIATAINLGVVFEDFIVTRLPRFKEDALTGPEDWRSFAVTLV